MDAVALTPVTVTGVEVYDSPRHFTRNGTNEPVHNTMLVIGVSAEIRALLRINGEWDDHNNYATVRRGQGSAVRVRVVCTDTRLMSGGEAQADNPSCHCWMTPEVRELLQERGGLPDDAQVPAPHRAQYPAFKKKFAPVTLVKATIPVAQQQFTVVGIYCQFKAPNFRPRLTEEPKGSLYHCDTIARISP